MKIEKSKMENEKQNAKLILPTKSVAAAKLLGAAG